ITQDFFFEEDEDGNAFSFQPDDHPDRYVSQQQFCTSSRELKNRLETHNYPSDAQKTNVKHLAGCVTNVNNGRIAAGSKLKTAGIKTQAERQSKKQTKKVKKSSK